MMGLLSVGVDIGATKIACALVDSAGRVLDALQRPTLPQRGASAVIEDVAEVVASLCAAAEKCDRVVNGVGVGCPGQVDSSRGIVRNAVNLGWTEVPLADELSAKLPALLPIRVEKDTNAAAWGEHVWGAGRGVADFVLLSIGSGLGGAVVAGGKLIKGAWGSAAEVGHISVISDGGLCTCGLRGCAETVVSGPGLVTVARRLIASGAYPSQLQDSEDLTSQAIVQAFRHGDSLASAAIEELSAVFSVVVSFAVGLLNPARVIIGGGLGLAIFDHLQKRLQHALPERVIQANCAGLEIVPSLLHNPALGAASLVQPSSDQERR